MKKLLLLLAAVTTLAAVPARAELMPIRNDSAWLDTAGNEISAQGGSIFKEGDTWYWYGFDGSGDEWKVSRRLYRSVVCYSSKDLSTWKFEGVVFDDKDLIPNRLDVVRSAKTGKYVMLSKQMGKQKGVGIAISDTPTGKFAWQGWMLLPDSVGGGDQSVFVDDDGKAYLIYTPWNQDPVTKKIETNRHLSIVELTPELTDVARVVVQLKDTRLEAPCIMKRNGKYYWFNSQVHWWYSSPTSWSVADKLEGPWAPFKKLTATHPPDHPHSKQFQADGYNAQVDFIVHVQGDAGSFYMFCGDRYSNYTMIGAGRVVWLPMSFNGDTPHLDWRQTWYIDAAKGTWSDTWDKPPVQRIDEKVAKTDRPTVQIDRTWLDADGNEIQAQGGDVVQTPKGFYWYGVAYDGIKPKEIRCYFSTDLVNWKLEGTALTPAVGRLVRAFEDGGKFTLVVKDGTTLKSFTSASPSSGFAPGSGFELPGVTADGTWSLFTDDDGQRYVAYPTDKSIVIAKIAPDFSSISPVHTFERAGRDAPTIVKSGGVYSCIVGNVPDAMRMSAGILAYSKANSLSGPWSDWKKLNEGWEKATVVPNTAFRVKGEGGRVSWVSAGERYTQLSNYGAGNYAWMPFFFHQETQTPSLFWLKPWVVDPNAESLGVDPKSYYISRKPSP